MGRFTHRACALAAVAGVVLLAACGTEAPTAPPARVEGNLASASSRYVILLDSGASTMSALVSRAQALGARVIHAEPDIGVVTVDGLGAGAVAALANRRDVAGIVPDIVAQMIPPRDVMLHSIVHVASDQSGAFFFSQFQWNLRQIRADQAWTASAQGVNTLVCILDTGIDPNHLDLSGKVDLDVSTSFIASDPDILDRSFHGTFVSALISSNGIGMASVAPDARLCAIKVLGADGSGSFADVISGIVYAAQHHANVINMSFGAYVPRQSPSVALLVAALQRAVNYARRLGTLPVASAGNDTVNLARDGAAIEIPAQLSGVVSVGATAPVDQQDFDALASYTSFGFPGVDVFAPGGDFIPGQGVIEDLIFSACSGLVPGCEGELAYALGAGTSFAAPHVSGEAAVIDSDARHALSPVTVTACIERTSAHPTGRTVDPVYGHGRIDVLAATECVD